MSYIGASILTYIGYINANVITEAFQIFGLIGGGITLTFSCLRMFEMWRLERAKRKKEEKNV